MKEWKHSDRWLLLNTNYAVEVTRHTGAPIPALQQGPHRWCVYAYIYPVHPHFKNFSKTGGMSQDAATEMPLHCGPSLLVWNCDRQGEVKSVQVGADYNHLDDEHFTHYGTAEAARSVFNDAEELFKWLEEKGESK